MSNMINWTSNQLPKTEDRYLYLMESETLQKVRNFHQSFPQYERTPLAQLSKMSEFLGLKDLFVKDESYRFGLNAFKVLGGSYAIARYIAKQTNQEMDHLPYSTLTSKHLKEQFGQATFFTATDGNHGRGVAWSANQLGQKAVVFMPKGTTLTRLNHILKEHATATIEEVNYDECVRMANHAASQTENGIVIQDTAWEGYEEVPSWIMQGYATMAIEAEEQLLKAQCERPTHIFIQAGVGSLAGAVCAYFVNRYKEHPPTIVVVEANTAACLYESAKRKDGNTYAITGDMPTIMAGLACGEPNTISWDILVNHASAFVSVPDWVSVKGMRMLAAPIQSDPQVISGESGAVTMGLVATLMTDPSYNELKEFLALTKNSSVLLFSTEGDTDPERYRQIVWEGEDEQSFLPK